MSISGSLKRCVEDLFSKNTDYKYPEQAINQAESLKSLSSDLYTDNIRFIYELLQNADDAQAQNVTLTILDQKYLIITHDGKSFDEKDLQGLCGVNNGTKKKDLDKTGYKGLGFKAVFGKSDYVIIYSNGEYFRFDSSYKIKWNKQLGTDDQQIWEKENDRQFIYPWQINPIWTNQNEIPSLIKNFLNSSHKQIHVANIILLNNVEEIRLALDQLKQQPYMFLFLRNISEMTFFSDSTDTISISRDLNYGLKKIDFNQKMISQWIIKRLELDVPNEVRDKLSKDSKAPEKLRFSNKAELFFAAKYKDPEFDESGKMINCGSIEKLHDKESHLFSYLPTKIFDYIFPILINANFLTNANREQIHTDSAWNQWLFDEIGIHLFEWIKELVVNAKFHFEAYKLIPTKLTLTDNPLSQRFNKSFDWAVKHCQFILNRKNRLLTVNKVIMDSTLMSEQTSFINIQSMRQYIIDCYKNSYFQCADDPFIDYNSNLRHIGVRQFTWSHCIEMFKSNIFLVTHSIEQNIQMIEYFHSKFLKLGTTVEAEINIEQIPFLMDQNNCLQICKDIYFPAETVGDSGTADSNESFVNNIIFNWLNEYKQKEIKQWLVKLGVAERTDLSYLHKTIIPNASTYITPENALETIRMLYKLFEKNLIEKTDLNKLKQLKLLTTREILIPAEQCFFSHQYKPRLLIEDYLTETEDKFLSPKYLTDYPFSYGLNDISNWHRFFIALGVHDHFYLIHYEKKIRIDEAIKYGFSSMYLTRPSPNRCRQADGYSGLKIISFLNRTEDNYEFAQMFWSFVTENMEPSDLSQYSTRVFWGSSCGTEIPDVDYIKWFTQNIPCIPTTLTNCQLSQHTFIDTYEMKQLCGTYMPVVCISSKQNLSKWASFFSFKTKFSFNDYLQLLDKIREDRKNLENNEERIQLIYFHLLNESLLWSLDEQKLIETQAKTLYLLTGNNQWKLTTDLYVYLEDNYLNDVIPCLQLNFENKNHPQLSHLLNLLHIKQINSNDMHLVYNDGIHGGEFRKKLIDILPFMKKWLQNLKFPTEVFQLLDKIIQQEINFIETDSLQLFYNENFVLEINVYFDANQREFYLTRPWNSETTLMELPNKLCRLLNIKGFEDKFRLLLKAQMEEVIRYFNKHSIEIPTDNDVVILEMIPREEIVKRSKPLRTSNSPEETETYIHKSQNEDQINSNDDGEVYTKRELMDGSSHYDSAQLLNEKMTRNSNKRRTRLSTSNNPINETFSYLDLIDLSSISNSSSARIKTSFNRNRVGGNGEADRRTGLIGEEFVYEYLLNKYRHQLDSVSITWLNENEEAHLQYDILLINNGIKHYIEVKTTRSVNQHTFFMSINQIDAILQLGDKYYIYRVYLKEEKLLILDNIQSRLKDKNQLALLLTMNPKSLDQTIFIDE